MKKILTVSTDQQLLRTVTEDLTKFNFEVKTLGAPGKLLELIKDFTPDVLVLDFILEDNNAAAISHQLKSANDTRNLPIIILTDQPGTGEFASKSGCFSVLRKPVSIAELAETITAALEENAGL